ncbi:Mitogen-activated protein kinase 2 [Leucoagaricus sp. SymC.cos]|nr:Mitogen-activated protein kinase 2 [Leucoagaricus sp. SymC.cos]
MSSRKYSKSIPKSEIGDEYQLLHTIGEGAYGAVAAALYKPAGRQVATKKILPFDHTLFALRTLRELKSLKFFSATCVNENIILILDIIKPDSLNSFKEELMQTDLHSVIRTQHLTDDHCQYFIYQTLQTLKSIYGAGFVHRDPKPANLLLNANCDLKACDFGLARNTKPSIPPGKEVEVMTECVATRWYRAPEIMVSFKMYVYEVGCILVELLNRRRCACRLLWRDPKKSSLDLLFLGTPTPDEF